MGGANSLTKQIARITGGQAVITTQSDNTDLWACTDPLENLPMERNST